jgi:hypothetical protein
MSITEIIKMACDMIVETAREAGPLGAPSGVVYAALSAHGMTLNVYQQIVDALVDAGRITVENHCIKAI